MSRETWDAVSIGKLDQRVEALERQLSELQADPDGYTARLRRDRAAQERLERIARERRSAVTRDDVERAVEAFKDAWHAADRRGERGNRVRAGLAAAAPFLGAELAELVAHAALADSDVIDVSAYDKPATIAGRGAAPAASPDGEPDSSAVAIDLGAVVEEEPCKCRAHSGDNGTAGW